MSFLHLLSLLTGHSISCKPSLSTNIPLFIKYIFCCEPSVSIQPNLSNEHSVSDVCKTEPLQEHCVMTEPLSIPCMTDLLSIVPCTCSWVAEHSVVSEPSVFKEDISAIEPVYPRWIPSFYMYVHCSIWRCAYPHACYFSTAIYSLCILTGVCCAVLVVFCSGVSRIFGRGVLITVLLERW